RRLPRRRDGPPAGLPGSHRGRAHPGVPHGEEVRMAARRGALSVLALDTFAFTACFALWMLNGVLVTHLVETQTFTFDAIEVGWLLGAPVLTGSLLRLPVGMLTDRYGGRRVFSGVLLASALGALLLAGAETFAGFLVGSLAFGLAGT